MHADKNDTHVYYYMYLLEASGLTGILLPIFYILPLSVCTYTKLLRINFSVGRRKEKTQTERQTKERDISLI